MPRMLQRSILTGQDEVLLGYVKDKIRCVCSSMTELAGLVDSVGEICYERRYYG